jgi:hypothetical protein
MMDCLLLSAYLKNVHPASAVYPRIYNDDLQLIRLNAIYKFRFWFIALMERYTSADVKC